MRSNPQPKGVVMSYNQDSDPGDEPWLDDCDAGGYMRAGFGHLWKLWKECCKKCWGRHGAQCKMWYDQCMERAPRHSLSDNVYWSYGQECLRDLQRCTEEQRKLNIECRKQCWEWYGEGWGKGFYRAPGDVVYPPPILQGDPECWKWVEDCPSPAEGHITYKLASKVNPNAAKIPPYEGHVWDPFGAGYWEPANSCKGMSLKECQDLCIPPKASDCLNEPGTPTTGGTIYPSFGPGIPRIDSAIIPEPYSVKPGPRATRRIRAFEESRIAGNWHLCVFPLVGPNISLEDEAEIYKYIEEAYPTLLAGRLVEVLQPSNFSPDTTLHPPGKKLPAFCLLFAAVQDPGHIYGVPVEGTIGHTLKWECVETPLILNNYCDSNVCKEIEIVLVYTNLPLDSNPPGNQGGRGVTDAWW